MEANIVGILAEALTADVEVVLADETSLVSADAAKRGKELDKVQHYECGIQVYDGNERKMAKRKKFDAIGDAQILNATALSSFFSLACCRWDV